MLKLNIKFSASTLVETVVSSVIILIVYSSFLIILLFHTKYNNLLNVYLVNNEINKLFYDMEGNDSLRNQNYFFNDLIIQREIIKLNYYDGYIVSVDVFDVDRKSVV